MNEARQAALAAGFPETVPVQVINRFCSSGLMAVTDISNKIRVGQIDIGLAIGAESMTHKCAVPFTEFCASSNKSIRACSPDSGGPPPSAEIQAHPVARDCSMPMGWTSENVAHDFGISRADMDEFAALSFQRAERADKSGVFTDEIVPFTAFVKDPHTGERSTKIVAKDDGIRYGTTKDNLSRIKPAFPQWSPAHTTGGNASQITDGVAAVLLMTRKKAEELGVPIVGKHVTTTVAGLAPRIMGIGPTYAIPKVLESVGITKDDVDLFEVNYYYVIYKPKIDLLVCLDQ